MTTGQKVAVATGTDINRHFGWLRGYVVIAMRDAKQRVVLARRVGADGTGGA